MSQEFIPADFKNGVGIKSTADTLLVVTPGEFEEVVQQHHKDLYWFALALTRDDNEARELTQETFYIWARKGRQLRDASRLRSWLFTVLRREFLRFRFRDHATGHIITDPLRFCRLHGCLRLLSFDTPEHSVTSSSWSNGSAAQSNPDGHRE